MKSKVLNILNKAYENLENENLENENNSFICTSITNPLLLPDIPILERVKISSVAIKYLHQNKPTKTLHKEFYENKYFKDEYVWWDHKSLHFSTHTEEEVNHLKRVKKERLRFFKYIIDNFNELYKN